MMFYAFLQGQNSTMENVLLRMVGKRESMKNLQDQSSDMENVLIRMVGKRESTKTCCNWLQDTNCLDRQSLIITKLGFPTFPERGPHYGERKHDGVDFQNYDEFRNSLLRKRFVPPLKP